MSEEIMVQQEQSYLDALLYHPVGLPCPRCGQKGVEADDIGEHFLRCKNCGWMGSTVDILLSMAKEEKKRKENQTVGD